MKMLMLLLLVSISGCSPEDLPTLPNTCIPSSVFGKAYCAAYSLKKMSFEGRFETKPISVVDDAICISKEDWLTLLKPAIKENYRVEADNKKKLMIGGHTNLRMTYEVR